MSARSHDSGHSHWFRFRAVGFGLAIAAASAFIVAQPVRAASAQFCFGFGGGPHAVLGGGISFLPDGIHGWAVSPRLSTPEVGPGCQVGPGVMATSDGGQTWRVERVPLSVRALTGITFVDQLDGWAVGSQAIVATSNGGASWTVQDTPQQTELYNVAFANALTGWAVGSDIAGNPAGVILSTSNGGASWIRQSLPSGIDSLFSVTAVNANDAWAVGQMACSSPGPDYPCPGAIVATTNGGQSWTLQALPAGVVTLQGVSFVNGTTGWAVGIGGGVDCLSTGTCSEAVIATTNGGASWHSQAVLGSGLGGLTDVDFISSTQGWAIGGRLLSTLDGGATWREGTLPNGASVRGIRFTSLKTGWLFGGASFFPAPANIFKTIDAGATWQMEQIPLERTSVRDVALAGSVNGIAAGQTCFALG